MKRKDKGGYLGAEGVTLQRILQEIGGQHYYYGNLKALCDHWDKYALGVGYAYLRNYGISEEKPFRNTKCVIRRGILVTSAKK